MTGCRLSFFTPRLIPCFFAFFEDFQIRVSYLRLDILTNSTRKQNIYTSKSKFGFSQPEMNQILKIEDVAIVYSSLRILHFFHLVHGIF